MLQSLIPKESVLVLTDIDLNRLWEMGKNALIIDMDNTLLPWHGETVSDAFLTYFCKARRMGFKLAVLSNNQSGRVDRAAAQVQAIPIPNAAKPLGCGYKRAMERLNAKKQECVFIGDQLFTDILGANRIGIYSVLVEPFDDKEYAWTRFMRRLERPIRKRLRARKE